MNKGYCETTAIAIELSDNAAFVFHAYTATAARGQGRIPALLSAAAETLRRRAGIAYVVGTTELMTSTALSAFASAGIKKTASYWRCGVGKWTAGWYPKPAPPAVKYGD